MFSKLVNWQQVPVKPKSPECVRACSPAGAGEDGFMVGDRHSNCPGQLLPGGDICLWPHIVSPGAGTMAWSEIISGNKVGWGEAGSRKPEILFPGAPWDPHHVPILPARIQDRVPLRSLNVRTEIVSNPVPMISCHSVWSEAVRENQWECGNSGPGPITWQADKWLSGSSSTPHSEFRLRLRNKWIEWVRQCIISKTSSIKYRQTQDLFLSIAIVTPGRVRVNWFSIDLSPSPHDWIWPGHWPFSLWLALMGPIFQVWFWPDMAWVTMLRDSNNHQY